MAKNRGAATRSRTNRAHVVRPTNFGDSLPKNSVRDLAMNPAETKPHPEAEPTPPSSVRFEYASGDRPLDGYTIKRGIGHGGFGEVYYATSDAGKEVALKLVRRNLEIELRGVQQCLNLKHPNLLTLFDIRRDARGES